MTVSELRLIHVKRKSILKNLNIMNKKQKYDRAAYLKKYYQDNKEKLKEKQKIYYKENKDKILIKQKEYYEFNKAEIAKKRKSYSKEYYIKNREIILEKQKENYKKKVSMLR